MLTADGERLCVAVRGGRWTIDELAGDCDGDSGECRENIATVQPGQPDPTDPATAGCLLALLGSEAWRVKFSTSFAKRDAGTPWVADLWTQETGHASSLHPTLGAACIAVAEALGRWPGGAP